MEKHYIITNREVTKSPPNAKHYVQVNDEEYLRIDGRESSSDSLRFGTYQFEDMDDKGTIELYKEPDLERLEGITKDQSDEKVLPSVKAFKDVFRRIKSKKEGTGEILFFIHGYKSDLEKGLETIKKLHEKYVETEDSPIDTIVFFSWPAAKRILRYRDDARDARTSGYALGRSIQILIDYLDRYVLSEQDCKQRLHLMAHSMGNQVLEAMIAELTANGKLRNIFSEVFLVGSDIDYDALESPKPLYDLIDICERIHVYYHNGDKALGISERTKNAFNRLGRWGAKNSRMLPDDVYQYDVSFIDDDDGLINTVVHHWYYFNSPTVVRMITDNLTENLYS